MRRSDLAMCHCSKAVGASRPSSTQQRRHVASCDDPRRSLVFDTAYFHVHQKPRSSYPHSQGSRPISIDTKIAPKCNVIIGRCQQMASWCPTHKVEARSCARRKASRSGNACRSPSALKIPFFRFIPRARLVGRSKDLLGQTGDLKACLHHLPFLLSGISPR